MFESLGILVPGVLEPRIQRSLIPNILDPRHLPSLSNHFTQSNPSPPTYPYPKYCTSKHVLIVILVSTNSVLICNDWLYLGASWILFVFLGDEILSINGQVLQGMTHGQVKSRSRSRSRSMGCFATQYILSISMLNRSGRWVTFV